MISIIIPIYNGELFLRDCLESVANQTYKDFEVICVNDGSPDNSAAICQEFVDEDDRFILINQENGGVSSARNRALQELKGEYVCFVDADDVIEAHFLENLLEQAKDGAFAVCSYARDLSQLTVKTSKYAEYTAKEFIHNILNESIEHPNIWTMLFKTSIIQMKHLDFTVGCVRNEDTEFYLKYLANETKVRFSDYKGYYYRDHINSAMHKLGMKSLKSSIEADIRISLFLKENGFTDDENLIVPAGVQYFIYQTARQGNQELYDYLHECYAVRAIMKRITKSPRLARRGVAYCYLLLGRKVFFKVLVLLNHIS